MEFKHRAVVKRIIDEMRQSRPHDAEALQICLDAAWKYTDAIADVRRSRAERTAAEDAAARMCHRLYEAESLAAERLRELQEALEEVRVARNERDAAKGVL